MPAGALIADRYRLLGQLPAVPPRVLWLARDEWSGQLVSATQVPISGLDEPEIQLARYDLSREVRAAESCQHRHVARPKDVVLDADDLWVVSESMPETTLAGVLARHGRVEPEQAARWGRDIADALAAAHGADVLHRDLHAAVVSLAEDGAAVVGGFAATVVSPVGLSEGIPLHVAPEVARGAQASPAADVFALAALLYTAMEGSGPYPAAHDRAQLLHAAAAGEITAPQQAGPLSDLLVQMLDSDPDQRPSAATVRDLLAQITCAPPGASRRRRRALIAIVVLGVLMLVCGLLVALMPLGAASQPGSIPAKSRSSQPDCHLGRERVSARVKVEGIRRMRQSQRTPTSGVHLLPAGTGSLARGLPPAPRGTLFALGERGGISASPTARFTVVFGRNEPEVHVCVGEHDRRVSRKQGMLRSDGNRWTIHNVGNVPIRFPGSQLLLSGQEEPLPIAYTPLFIRTEPGREHLLEVRIAGAPSTPSTTCHEQPTENPRTWKLTDRERLVLVVLGQRYLRHEAHPQPLSWNQVAEQLAEVQPQVGWTAKRAEHVVGTVRGQLAQQKIPGLTRLEVGEPVGNALNHNLLLELLLSTTLVPPDLRLLD